MWNVFPRLLIDSLAGGAHHANNEIDCFIYGHAREHTIITIARGFIPPVHISSTAATDKKIRKNTMSFEF